jgi:hypothetical protein
MEPKILRLWGRSSGSLNNPAVSQDTHTRRQPSAFEHATEEATGSRTRGRRARGGHDRGGAGETGPVIVVIGAVTVGVVVRQKVLVQEILHGGGPKGFMARTKSCIEEKVKNGRGPWGFHGEVPGTAEGPCHRGDSEAV